MWKGLTADPTVLHHHAKSFAYPERLEIIEIGDRVELYSKRSASSEQTISIFLSHALFVLLSLRLTHYINDRRIEKRR